MTMLIAVIVWLLPKGDSEARVWVQIAPLGDDVRKGSKEGRLIKKAKKQCIIEPFATVDNWRVSPLVTSGQLCKA